MYALAAILNAAAFYVPEDQGVEDTLKDAAEDLWNRVPLAASLLYLAFATGWEEWTVSVGWLAIADIALNAVLFLWDKWASRKQ